MGPPRKSREGQRPSPRPYLIPKPALGKACSQASLIEAFQLFADTVRSVGQQNPRLFEGLPNGGNGIGKCFFQIQIPTKPS